MTLAPLDWTIIGGYLLLTTALGVIFTSRASGGLESYFVAGRTLPWYLIGSSMVATTFAADTPIAVTALVRESGVAGAWYGWCKAMAAVTVTLFYAQLWRRSRVLTDAELVELRYAGKPALALRLARAIYLAVPVNCLVLGWVILAMVNICQVVLGFDQRVILPLLLVLAVGYSTASGFWGVVATDALQFVVAMTGAIALAWCSLRAAGGAAGLREALAATPHALEFVPRGRASGGLPLSTFAAYALVQWWAERNADGSEYIGQRLLAARDARHAQLGMAAYALGEFALKIWPLIITGIASLALLPDVPAESAYPQMIVRYLPSGLRGLLVASLLAAFMSTVDTHLNWGASYLVNDVYRRLVRPEADEAHYVRVSRVAMVVTAALGCATSLLLESVTDAWKLLLALGAGQGSAVLARWYWWRVNAWSEISAMVASVVITLLLYNAAPLVAWVAPDVDPSYFAGQAFYGVRLAAIVAGSTAIWVAVTLRSAPEPDATLDRFYQRVLPGGPGWGAVRRRLGIESSDSGVVRGAASWLLGAAAIYGATFGVGALALGLYVRGGGLLLAAGFASVLFVRRLGA